ncbi:MAG: hypothetical protein EOL87_14585 [Spartobacteria bacterium]|nr:hypothetical protein [Spartobacteria bacterium]
MRTGRHLVYVIVLLTTVSAGAVNLRLSPEEAIALRERQRRTYDEQMGHAREHAEYEHLQIKNAMEQPPWPVKQSTAHAFEKRHPPGHHVLRIILFLLIGVVFAFGVYKAAHRKSKKRLF